LTTTLIFKSILKYWKLKLPAWLVCCPEYYALIHPSLLYGIIIRESNYLNYLQKLSILQNKAPRAICGAHYHDSASPIYAKMKVLKIVDLHKYEIKNLLNLTLPGEHSMINQSNNIIDVLQFCKYEITKFAHNWNLSKTPALFNDYFQE